MAVPTLHSVLIFSLLLMSIGFISWISWMKEVVEKSIFRIMPILSEIGGSEELFDLQLRIDSNLQMNEIYKFQSLLLNTIMGSYITILSLFIIRLLVLFCTLYDNSSCAFLIPCFYGPTVHCHHENEDEDNMDAEGKEGEEQDHEIEINSDDMGGNDLIFIVFCENYVSELRTGRVSLSIRGYEKDDHDNSEDRIRRSGEDFIWAPSGSTKNFFAMYSENCVFKEYFGFEEGGGYEADLSWIDYNNLHLYSKEVHNHINFDIKCGDCIVIVEI